MTVLVGVAACCLGCGYPLRVANEALGLKLADMSRLPFDPTRASGASGVSDDDSSVMSDSKATGPSESGRKTRRGGSPTVHSPTSLSGLIEEALAGAFPTTIRIRGEVSNFRERNHWYFAIKDNDASIACTCWASTARKIAVDMEDGLEIIVSGRMAYYGPQGKLQVIVSKVEHVGRGALEAELKKRADELRQLGYFDEANKRALPLMPRAVAVVTSRSAAALQDVLDTARRRWPGVKLYLFDVRVQGDAAAGEVATAIDAISGSAASAGIDAVIVARGGGSMEDLWAFNERIVCDAVFNCSIPIVAAIGHETDTTLAELCADHRAATPTQAATLLVPERDRLTEQLRQTQDRLRLIITRRAASSRQQLEALARHPALRRPDEQLAARRRGLAQLEARLARVLPGRTAAEARRVDALAHRLARAAQQTPPSRTTLDTLSQQLARAATARQQTAGRTVDALEKRLASVSPARVLNRGFSYTLGPDGRVLKSTNQARSGQLITTVLAEGTLRSRVITDAAAETEKSSKPTARRKRPTRKPPRQPMNQPHLFDPPPEEEVL